MFTFITVIHVIVALFLILFVLLQDSKGGAMGSLGGGASGSSSVFGLTGASSFLVKATRWVAILFAITCILLTMKTVQLAGKTGTSVVDDVAPSQEDAAAMAPLQNDSADTAPAANSEAVSEKAPESGENSALPESTPEAE